MTCERCPKGFLARDLDGWSCINCGWEKPDVELGPLPKLLYGKGQDYAERKRKPRTQGVTL